MVEWLKRSLRLFLLFIRTTSTTFKVVLLIIDLILYKAWCKVYVLNRHVFISWYGCLRGRMVTVALPSNHLPLAFIIIYPIRTLRHCLGREGYTAGSSLNGWSLNCSAFRWAGLYIFETHAHTILTDGSVGQWLTRLDCESSCRFDPPYDRYNIKSFF